MLRISMLMLSVIAVSAAAITPSDHDMTASDVTPVVRQAAADSHSEPHQSATVELLLTDQFHGVARPSQLAELPALVRGTIRDVHVHEGQAVRRGDPLITLDDRVPESRLMAATVKAGLTGALQRAEVEHRMADRRCRRLQEVMHRGAAAEFELEEAEAAREQALAAVRQQRDILKAAEAERRVAAAQLDQFTVSAPFDGVVTEIHRKTGAVDPSVPLITVANISVLEVEMYLPSGLYGTVRRGELLKLRAGTPVADVLSATVVSVSPVIHSASETFRCLLQMPNTDGQHPAGFSVTLESDPSDDRRGRHDQTASTGSGRRIRR